MKTFIIFAVVLSVAVAEGADCASKFKQDVDKHSKTSEECIKELKINPEDMPKSEEEFKKSFDDKCFGKCFMNKMGFLADLKINRDEVKKDIEENVLDAAVKEKVTTYTLKCLDDAEKSVDGKLTKDNECKAAAVFLYCTMKQEEKLEC